MVTQVAGMCCGEGASEPPDSLSTCCLLLSSLAEKVMGELITLLFTKLVTQAMTFFPCKEPHTEEQSMVLVLLVEARGWETSSGDNWSHSPSPEPAHLAVVQQ